MFLKLAKRQEGFTLVELLIVITIIGILAAIAVPRFLTNRANSQRTACQGNLSRLNEAIGRFTFENGAAPGTVAALVPTYMDREPFCPQTGSTGASYTVVSGLSSCPNSHVLP